MYFAKIFIYFSLQAFSVIDRTNLIDDALNLAQGTHVDYPTALSLTDYMIAEKEYFVWHSAKDGLGYISTMLYGHLEYHLWRVYIFYSFHSIVCRYVIPPVADRSTMILLVNSKSTFCQILSAT